MATKVTSPDNLPRKPGIYIMKDKNEEIIYVGKSKSLKNRVKSYFKDKVDRPKTRVLMQHFNSLEYIVTSSEKEALILEANLIKKHRPKYNIRLKDDKRYPYVKITNEDFPRLIITRNITKDGSYFGPFTDVGSVRATVKFLKQLFKIRTCKNMDGPCLNYQINLCYAPCDDNITKEQYGEIINKIDLFFQGKYNEIIKSLKEEMKNASSKQEFEKAAVLRDQIDSIEEVMVKQFVDLNDELDQDIIATSDNKDTTVVVVLSIRGGKIISKDDFLMNNTAIQENNLILYSFIQQYYGINRHVPKELILEDTPKDEKLISQWLSDLRGNKVSIIVPQKGDKLRLVRMAHSNADIIKKQKEKVSTSLIELQNYLKLENVPHVIEGYDVSNISGTLQVGSKVSFFDGDPNKKQYKRFKLETPGPDDYGMMRELLTRRFTPISEDPQSYKKPDLVVIDGGKGQLNIACEVFENLGLTDIPVIGLAKEFEEVFIPQSLKPIIIPKNKKSLHILQRVRDESHRFAVTYHRKLRSKKIEESPLDNIDGIGKKRKINLLKHFKDINSIKSASVEDLASVGGMNKKAAQNVYNYFN